jgi:hypothetical protein
MRRTAIALITVAAAALFSASVATAQPPGGVDAAMLDELCATNARSEFEYQVCVMVVHTILVPDPFNPVPSGTYVPDGPQGSDSSSGEPAASPSPVGG